VVSMPQFDFKSLLWGLVCCLLILFTLTPLFFRNVRWVRLFGYFMAVAQILNAAGHTWVPSQPDCGFRSLPQASTGLLFFVFAAESLRCI
jgi:hypothetical protein